MTISRMSGSALVQASCIASLLGAAVEPARTFIWIKGEHVSGVRCAGHAYVGSGAGGIP